MSVNGTVAKKNKRPLVSIIVPTYNQGKYLPSCLDSIMNQSYPNIEVIVANDASPDNTDEVFELYLSRLERKEKIVTGYDGEKIVRETVPCYPKQIQRILYLKNKQNLGASENYSRGFSAAKGEYLKFMPSDDILLPNHVELLASALEKGFDFAYSDFVLVDDMLCTELKYTLPEYDFETCMAKWYRLGPSHLFKKTFYKKSGGFSPDYEIANDYDLFLRFAMDGARFIRVPSPLYYKRSHKNRRIDQWDPSKYKKLIEESMKCADRARAWIGKET